MRQVLIALVIADIYNTCAISREGKWRTIFCVYVRKGPISSMWGFALQTSSYQPQTGTFRGKHASTHRVRTKFPHLPRKHLDFGRGFYLTALREQAEKYGQRFLRKGEEAYLNIYKFDEELQGFSRIVFDAYDSQWLDYVTACRKGQPHPTYDIIEGGIADDQVFDTIDLYFSGIYTFEQALDQLRFKRPNHQVCITNQDVLDGYLHFVESIKL